MMKNKFWFFFKSKNLKIRAISISALLLFFLSVVILTVTNKKNSYPLTSLSKEDTSYELCFDNPNQDKNIAEIKVKVDKQLLKMALNEIGVTTKQNPLSIFIKLSDDSISPEKQAWLNSLKYNLNYLSSDLLNIEWEPKYGTTIPTSEWKTNGNASAGYVLWSPDYNGAGTWFEPYFLLNSDGTNANSYWSAWPSLLKHLYHVEKNRDYYNTKKNEKYLTDNQKQISYYEIVKSLEESLTSTKILSEKWTEEIDKLLKQPKEWIWEDIISRNILKEKAVFLGKQIGLWVNEDNSHALWLEQFLDSQMSFIPQSQNQYMTTSALHQTWLFPRNSCIDGPNYRDYGSTEENSVINLATPTRLFETTKTPLNPCFQDWTVHNNFNSTLCPIVTWVTEGNITGINEKGEVIQPIPYLQAAEKIELYNENGSKDPLYTIEKNGPIDFNNNILKEALNNANVYKVKIDENLRWIDTNGQDRGKLGPRDFERGLEAYWLSSACGLCINGYFLDMVGLDLGRTLEEKDKPNEFNFEDILSPNYDINKFQENNDGWFNFYLKEPYPLFLNLLSKENFCPLPNENYKVKNIATTSQKIDDSGHKGKIILNDKKNIDIAKTPFNELFGCGSSFENILDNFWSVGPYNVTNITNNQVIFQRNTKSGYWKQEKFADKKRSDKPIDKVILYYGTGNESVFYEKFLANQLDYVALETMNKVLAAEKNEKIRKCIVNVTPAKTAMSNYIVYTGKPYKIENGKYIKQSNLSNGFYKLMQWWNDDTETKLKLGNNHVLTRSQVSKIIRSSIFGMINFAQLARLQNSSGSFQYSLVPYGSMNVNTKKKDGTTVSVELYHYINYNKDDKPGAMLQALSTYLNPLIEGDSPERRPYSRKGQ